MRKCSCTSLNGFLMPKDLKCYKREAGPAINKTSLVIVTVFSQVPLQEPQVSQEPQPQREQQPQPFPLQVRNRNSAEGTYAKYMVSLQWNELSVNSKSNLTCRGCFSVSATERWTCMFSHWLQTKVFILSPKSHWMLCTMTTMADRLQASRKLPNKNHIEILALWNQLAVRWELVSINSLRGHKSAQVLALVRTQPIVCDVKQ